MEGLILFAMATLVFALVLGVAVKLVILIIEYKMRVYELAAETMIAMKEKEDEKANE